MAKTIPIDKDFLMKVLKKLDDLEKKIFELTQSKTQEIKPQEIKPIIKPEQDYVFECSMFLFDINPANELQRKVEMEEFKKELEESMKKYKVGRAIGTFIKIL